jgi:hypothetical protein
MLKNISSKALSSIILVLIICYGFFKILVLGIYSKLVLICIEKVGIDPHRFIFTLNNYAKKQENVNGILGWLIYYPTYFLLHILFIYLLFNKQTKTRNTLIVGLSVLVLLLVGGSAIAKWLDFNILYVVSYEAFQKLFGLPFILLFIEGGRILYKDVMGNSKSNTQNQ